MASDPAADTSSQPPFHLSDDEDPNPDTQDPYAEYPALPDRFEGMAWHQFPPDPSFSFDPEWFDTLGIDMIERRRIFASRSKAEQVAEALKLLTDYPKRGLEIMFSAAVKGKKHVIEALLDAGVKPHPSPLAPGETYDPVLGTNDDPTAVPLHAAAFNGHLACVRLLVENGGVDVNARDDMHGTPLMRASWGKHPEIVRWLLENGANPMMRQNLDPNHEGPNSGTNALEFAAGGGNIECARLLLRYHPQEELAGGELAEKDAERRRSATVAITPLALQAGANSGDVEMVQFLLGQGGYPMDNDDGVWKGERLHAEQRRNIENALLEANGVPVFRLLLKYLAQPNETEDFGVIDLPNDVKEGIMDVLMASVHKVETFKLLWNTFFSSAELTMLEHKGHTVPKSHFINTLLHEGAKMGSLDTVKFILAMPDADINAPGLKQVSHLYRAAIDQQLEIVRYFLENEHHKPDLHQGTGLYANGPTALFGAVIGGNVEIVKLILKHGGPIESPVDEAVISKEPKKIIVRCVQAYRAPVTIELWHSAPSKQIGQWIVELDLDENDLDWLSSIQIRKSDVELKRDDRGGRELRKQ